MSHYLIDNASPYGLGQILFERYNYFGARSDLEKRNWARLQKERVLETPRCVAMKTLPSFYGQRFYSRFEMAGCHGVEQIYEMPHDECRIDLTTTIWLQETIEPQAIYVAFPFLLSHAAPSYRAMEQEVRVGHDQIAGTNGECHVVGDGVMFSGAPLSLGFATPDAPLVSFDELMMRSGRTSFAPQSNRLFSLLHLNYWMTNAPISKAAKIKIRHTIAWNHSDEAPSVRALNRDLWAMTTR